jgi:hypothetical protein
MRKGSVRSGGNRTEMRHLIHRMSFANPLSAGASKASGGYQPSEVLAGRADCPEELVPGWSDGSDAGSKL